VKDVETAELREGPLPDGALSGASEVPADTVFDGVLEFDALGANDTENPPDLRAAPTEEEDSSIPAR
jgi:hypothetical protein